MIRIRLPTTFYLLLTTPCPEQVRLDPYLPLSPHISPYLPEQVRLDPGTRANYDMWQASGRK